MIVEPPFGLRLLLPFWCRRGGVLVHGWCAEKENRGKGGSGKGKIGAGVGSCRSMDPVRIPSGPSRAPIFTFFLQCFCMFLGDFGCFPTGPNVVPKIRKLVPDWIPTGQKRCPRMQKLVPDWVPTGSRPGFFKKTPISLNLSTCFWNFSTLPCTTPPPPFPPPDPPPPVLSQTRATQIIDCYWPLTKYLSYQ